MREYLTISTYSISISKGNMEAAVMKAAEKEYKLMDEQERKAYQKKFDESRLDLDKWKDKVEKDGRAEIIKNLESSLKERLKSLQFDKPTYVNPAICYYQKNYKSYEGKANGRLAKCMMQWKTLSDAEKEPYYESLNNYNKDMIVWKEKAGKDGRMKVIQLIKKLISQLKM